MTAQGMDESWLSILACPKCEQRPALDYEREASQLRCDACGTTYPIIEGIPHLVVETPGADAV